MSEFTVERAGVALAGEEAGDGLPVVLLHGLTATRRYVVMGSRALERSGHRVVLYDARGHGRSSPAPDPADYGYEALTADLLAVLDDHGDRVAGLVVITPAYTPEGEDNDLARWDALSDGLREGGVEGFVAAYGDPGVPDAWRETVVKVLHQRLSAHEHPDAVADALRAVPRSRAFEDWAELGELALPCVVVASRDEVDPGHPYAVGARYAQAIPGAELRSEEPGASPLAWQGGQLSRVIAELAERVAA